MKIKSAKSFRTWYKSAVKEIDANSQVHNENFIGTYHLDNGKKIKGFFEMYHGDKPDIASYLPSILKIAEDGQAIYEFLQNAVDCGSTHFFIFYNEKYFLAINNGRPFDIEGLKSILNIAQTTKKDPDKIGRFGIGFKLAHRLVGKNEGTEELVRQYKGPILFSWSKLKDLISLLNNEVIEPISPPIVGTDNGFDAAPYLLKLLLTNFPSDLNETLKDINYHDKVLFPQNELKELVDFLSENFETHSDILNKNILNQGSLFFIKLGEDKRKLLDKDYSELVNGIQYSMNTLRKLEKVYINNDELSKIPLHLEEGKIIKDSAEFKSISPEYDEFDIKYAIGFNQISFGHKNTYDQILLLKEKPNFYKYFPMGDEINGLGFIIHCDSFSNEANRRKLHEDDVNLNLFPVLANHIIFKLEEYKNQDRNRFLNLYVSLLISDVPERQNNKWLKPVFYDKLLKTIQANIPTKDGFSNISDNVKINKLKLKLNLSDFGLSHIKWFEWDNQMDKVLIDEAKKESKLNIKEWDIKDVVENADLIYINNWISSIDDNFYRSFLNELASSSLRNETRVRLCAIKLFKFSDGKFYSLTDITGYIINRFDGKTGNYRFYRSGSRRPNFLFHTNKTSELDVELRKLNFITCELSIANYLNVFFKENANVYYFNEIQPDLVVYNLISEKLKSNSFTPQEKKKIFRNLSNEKTRFENINESDLRKLQLFCDNNSKIKPIEKLIGNISTPACFHSFKIKQDEYFNELNSYLLNDLNSVFDEIYLPNCDVINDEITTTEEVKSIIKLFQDNRRSFFHEFIIQEQEGFRIFGKLKDTFQVYSADKLTRNFIIQNCSENLFVLPPEFFEFKSEDGILREDDLHDYILEIIDVEDHKEQLVEIIKHRVKHNFFEHITEIRLNSNIEYTKDDFEYKILEIACVVFKDGEYDKFKDKVIIEIEDGDIKLSDIPPFKDVIKIDEYELNLSKILPDSYHNSFYLSNLISRFIELGINKVRLYNLFGISDEPELEEVYNLFSEQVKVLENPEQLAFLFLYGLQSDKIDFSQFKALNICDEEINLGYDKYLREFNFIYDDEILHPKYEGITNIIKKFPLVIEHNDNLLLLKEPCFVDDKFICPYIIDDLDDIQKVGLIEFLYYQWSKKNKKTVIKKIDWSVINDQETSSVLGFIPKNSVFPDEYSCDSEKLPDYLTKWIGNDKSKIDFISDLGVWTNSSLIVQMRRFLKGETESFHNNQIAQEKRFNENEKILFNSFEWLIENKIQLNNKEQIETFKKVVDVINENRTNGWTLRIEEKFDFDVLEQHSEEVIKNETYNIYQYLGEMPILVSLDEGDDYVFYQINKGDYAINGSDIFINRKEDQKKILQKVASDEENNFSFEDLWSLYGETSNRELELEKEIAELKRTLSSSLNASMGVENNSDLSKNDQKESNREAKEIVKQRLESEGFRFTKGLGSYSTIDGVIKDDLEYPLVVKSYKYSEYPLKVGANEWVQLMKPNSMLWVYFGNGKLNSIRFFELLKKQDDITLRFSTENLDNEGRLNKFANILRYFSNVHFNFNNLIPSNISNKIKDYRFNHQENESDLSADSENIL
jgi:hypothetical protein